MNVSEDPRAGLELERYHSWPRHRSQSVGEHSAQIMRILLTVWPDCPRRMLIHCLLHDIGEMAGDAQYPYKRTVPGLKEAHDAAEAMVRDGMERAFGDLPRVALTTHELAVFKLCEFLEMWEYGLRELSMGNQYARVIATRCILEASRILESLDAPVVGAPDVRPAVKRYVDTRVRWEMLDGQHDRQSLGNISRESHAGART